MTAPTYVRAHGLTAEQFNAVEHLLIGQTDAETAKGVGVSRETVTRWRLYDVAFQAHLEQRRRDVWAGAVDAVRAILPQAAQTIYGELRVGRNRGRLALDLLTRAGLMGKPYSGALGAFAEPSPTGPESGEVTEPTDAITTTASTVANGEEAHRVTKDHANSSDGATPVTSNHK